MRLASAAAIAVLLRSALAVAADVGGEAHGDPHINWWGFDTHAPAVGWYIVDFAIFLFFAIRFANAPLQNFFARRRREVTESIREATELKSAAETAAKSFTERLGRMDAEVDKLVTEFEQEGRLEQSRLVSAAERQAKKLKRDAEITIEQEGLRHRREMRAATVALALDMAQDLLANQLTPDQHQALHSDFLQSLDQLAEKRS